MPNINMKPIFCIIGLFILIGTSNALNIATNTVEQGNAYVYLENNYSKSFYIDYVDWVDEVYNYTKEIKPENTGRIEIEAEKTGVIEVIGHYSNGKNARIVKKIKVVEEENKFVPDYVVYAQEYGKTNKDYFAIDIEEKQDSLIIKAENWTKERQDIEIIAENCLVDKTKISMAKESEINERVFVYGKEENCKVQVLSSAGIKEFEFNEDKKVGIMPLINNVIGFFFIGQNILIGTIIFLSLLFYLGFGRMEKRKSEKKVEDNILKNTYKICE